MPSRTCLAGLNALLHTAKVFHFLVCFVLCVVMLDAMGGGAYRGVRKAGVVFMSEKRGLGEHSEKRGLGDCD